MRRNPKAVIVLLIGLGLLGYWGYQTFAGPKQAAAAWAAVVQQGNTITFSLKVKDASGRRIRKLKLANGKAAPAPIVEVFDKGDRKVYSAKMEAG